MTTFLVSFLLAFCAALALTPVMIGVARRVGAVDAVGMSHRKVHAAEMPRLGGVAIVVAFYLPIAALGLYRNPVGDAVLGDPRLAIGLLVGGLAIAALGMLDDVKATSPRVKLVVQVAVALLVVALGLRIEHVDLPFVPAFHLGWFAIPLTVLWIVGVTNAVNLIDGLDGLAAGVALVAVVPMAVIAVSRGNLVLALVCCCLAGAILGFLVFNFHPARIFMGDTGSMFLGFTLAVVAIASATKGRTAVALLTPILVLGLPILDTLLAIARRAWFGQSLFAGDRQHIHHKLMQAGYSHRGTVLVMYGFAAAFALLGMALHLRRDTDAALLFLLSLLTAGVLLRKIGVLAMPEGDLSVASAIRERNKLVRDLADTLDGRMALARALDEAVHGVAELAFTAGAASARLELRTPGAPVRSWAWAETPTAASICHGFPLVDDRGCSHGSLQITWSDDGSFHQAAMPRLESAVRLLAERMSTLLPADRIERPQSRAS